MARIFKTNKEQYTVFFRYMRSYILLFSMPLILSLLLFSYYIKIYQTEILDHHYERTRHLTFSVDNYMEQIQNVYLQMSTEPNTGRGMLRDGMHQMQLSKELSSYKRSNYLIHDLYYFQKDLTTGISSGLVFQLATADRFHIHYPAWPYNQMITDIYEIQSIQWRAFETVQNGPLMMSDVMTGIFPLPLSGYYNSAVLLVQIEKEKFEQLLFTSEQQSSFFAIVDENDQLLYASGDESGIDIRTLSENTNDFFTDETSGYFVSRIHSEVNNWTYYHAFPLRDAMEKVTLWRSVILLFTLLMLVIGSVTILFVTKRNYKPVKELKNVIHDSGLDIKNIKDEIGQAKSAIEYLNELRSSLEKKLLLSRSHVTESFILHLLQGKYSTINEFNQHSKEYGIEIRGNSIFAVAVSGINQKSVSLPLSAILTDQYDCYLVDIGREDCQVYICSRIDSSIVSVPDDIIRRINHEDLTELSLCHIGMSSETDNLSHTYRICLEALVALEQLRRNKSCSESVYSYSTKQLQYTLFYPSVDISYLRESISSRDREHFVNAYDTLYNFISNTELSSLIRLFICFEMINSMLNEVIKNNQNVFPLSIIEKYSASLFYQNANQLEAVIELMSDLKNSILNIWCSNEQERKRPIDKIYEYIDKHYKDSDFSAKMIADYMEMSLPALSSYFKKEEGINISQYITAKKMTYITELLRTTNLSMSEIANLAGYASTSSFIRKFRQEMGDTPGEYKKKYD